MNASTVEFFVSSSARVCLVMLYPCAIMDKVYIEHEPHATLICLTSIREQQQNMCRFWFRLMPVDSFPPRPQGNCHCLGMNQNILWTKKITVGERCVDNGRCIHTAICPSRKPCGSFTCPGRATEQQHESKFKSTGPLIIKKCMDIDICLAPQILAGVGEATMNNSIVTDKRLLYVD